jgi:pimeloyl-ACP methyl ester carboxylesterase
MSVVVVGGLSLSYVEKGTGEPVLFLHALGFDSSLWAHQIGDFSRDHRAVAFDAPDHGQSASAPREYGIESHVDAALGLLDALGISRCHWVGLSMGGMLAMRAALRAPERVVTLSLLSTSADEEDADLRRRYERFLRNAMGRPINAFEAELSQELLFSPGFRDRHPELVADYREKFMALPPDRLRRATLALLERDPLLPRLGAIHCPTLVLVGDRDTATPRAHSERIAQAIPGAELRVLAECGHLATMEQPEEVNAAIRTLIARAAKWRGAANVRPG